MEVKYRVIADTGYSVAKTTHCGILEFTADENSCYLPNWVTLLDVNALIVR